VIEILHTDVDDRYQGQGLGSELASRMLEDAREQGVDVVPHCPFVLEYIRRHPDYVDLVPADWRRELDL
jgi:predicted GNAT family acetyltransferase